MSIAGALTYQMTERVQIGLVARYARLLGDAADSPIVDEEGDPNQFFGGLLVGLVF